MEEQQASSNVRAPIMAIVMYLVHKFIKEELSPINIPC